MKKRKSLLKNKVKLINPVMRFDIGYLRYEIDIQKTKKLLKCSRKKKK